MINCQIGVLFKKWAEEMQLFFGEIKVNFPNKLTLLRLFLMPVIVILLLNEQISHRYIYVLILFFLAMLTDYLDGKIARKLKKVTVFGKFLDPLADKILITSIFVAFVQLNLVNAAETIIIISREFIVTSVRLVAISKNKIISANFWGKLKTISQTFTIIFILIFEILKNYTIFAQSGILKNIFMYITIFLTLTSGIVYIFQNLSHYKNN
jgi:CDP-diacylglycerol--glycerol-3-phosphate 3-phosphatidyltransferase